MASTVTRLYPLPPGDVAVRGLYLSHRLHELGTPRQPFVYADFVASLDARIAIIDDASGSSDVPRELQNANDLRLLLELHAQAECLITNAGYLRAIADRRLDDILQVGTVRGHEDLAHWRDANGLRHQPAICIVSASLDFRIPDSVRRYGQHVFVVTVQGAPAARIAELEGDGCEIVQASTHANVEGSAIFLALRRAGLRSAFLLAGPRLLDATLRDGVLSRFYITLTHELLGGEHYHSLFEGPRLAGAGRLKLDTLYLDSSRPNGSDQFFAQFTPLNRASNAA